MLTVKEVLGMLFEPEKVDLECRGGLVNFNFQNEIEVEAYGDYLVGSINATGDKEYELGLAVRLLKRGDT